MFDIIDLIETWNDYENEFVYILNGYTCFDNIRVKTAGTLRNGT